MAYVKPGYWKAGYAVGEIVNANATGGTGTSTGSGSGGTATGVTAGDGVALGGMGTSTGSGSGGTATGVTAGSGNASGGTGTSTGSGSGGTATGVSNASAQGGTGTSVGSGSGGAATGSTADASAPGGTGTSVGSGYGGTAQGTEPLRLSITECLSARHAKISTGYKMSDSHLVGELARLTMSIADNDGEPHDSEEISLKLIRPGSKSPITCNVADIKRETTGRYYFDVSTDASGHWYFRWELGNPVATAAEGGFDVKPSRFIK